MITIRKQKRGRWEDFLPAARQLHKESVDRFWSQLAQMARKENSSARPALSAAQCARVLVPVGSSEGASERAALSESFRWGEAWMQNFLRSRS
jgi:hypothetical protein